MAEIRHNRSVDSARGVPMREILRYAQGANRIDHELDGYLNYHFLTAPAGADDMPKLMLEAGITPQSRYAARTDPAGR
jgi:hypothetical protein